MEKEKNSDTAKQLMQTVYKNAKMGSEAVSAVVGKTKGAKLRNELTSQLEAYYGFETAAKNKLAEMSVKAEPPGVFSRLPSDISIRMSTMMDPSDSRIAQLMIEGYNTGAVEIRKSINRAQNEGIPQDVMNIANGIMSFEEGSAETMKKYL